MRRGTVLGMRRVCVALVVSFAVALVADPGFAASGGGVAGRPAGIGAAALSLTGVTVVQDVPYESVDGITLTLDVYEPDTGTNYPAVLVIHGGAWKSGSKEALAAEASQLATEGFVAFSVNYRLAPNGGTWHAPAPVEDIRAATAWVRAHASTYRVDAAHVGALGASAGGNLAQMAGTTGQPGADRPDAVVSWSGSSVLRLCVDSNQAIKVCNTRANYVGCDLATCPSSWDAASPVYNVTANTAPMYLANSTDELVSVHEPKRMAKALLAAGVPYELNILEGSGHATAYEDVVWASSVDFLHQYLG